MMKWFAKGESSQVGDGVWSDGQFPYAVEVARTKEAIESFIQEQLHPDETKQANPEVKEMDQSNSDGKEMDQSNSDGKEMEQSYSDGKEEAEL